MNVEECVGRARIDFKLLKEAEEDMAVISTNEAGFDERSEHFVLHDCEIVGELHDGVLENVLEGGEQCGRIEGVSARENFGQLWPWWELLHLRELFDAVGAVSSSVVEWRSLWGWVHYGVAAQTRRHLSFL